MRKRIKTFFGFLTIFFIFFASLDVHAREKLKIIASIFPLQEFARAVGGNWVDVVLLLPPGAEPHTWEPKPNDIASIAGSDIFIYIGEGMEPWVGDIFNAVKSDSLTVIEASGGMDLIGNKSLSEIDVGAGDALLQQDEKGDHIHHHEGTDPHIWLDFNYDQKIIDKIVHVFSGLDPERRDKYEENGRKYKGRLADLDKRYAEELKKCKHSKILLGGHSAFSYMAKRYGLIQVPLYGISPDAEPTPREMARLIDLANREGVRAIFFESLVNDALARVIAKDIGAETLVLNPGPNLTKEEITKGITFLAIMEKNLINLKKGLVCE